MQSRLEGILIAARRARTHGPAMHAATSSTRDGGRPAGAAAPRPRPAARAQRHRPRISGVAPRRGRLPAAAHGRSAPETSASGVPGAANTGLILQLAEYLRRPPALAERRPRGGGRVRGSLPAGDWRHAASPAA